MNFDEFLSVMNLGENISKEEYDRLEKKYQKLRLNIEKEIDKSELNNNAMV